MTLQTETIAGVFHCTLFNTKMYIPFFRNVKILNLFYNFGCHRCVCVCVCVVGARFVEGGRGGPLRLSLRTTTLWKHLQCAPVS